MGLYLPMVPFFLYVTIFMLLPTAFVLVGAFQDGEGGFTLDNYKNAWQHAENAAAQAAKP